MNCVDYFFENTRDLTKNFLVGRDEKSFSNLYSDINKLAGFLQKVIGIDNNILLLTANSAFFVTTYMAILKSGNTCVPLDPRIENENLEYIREQTNPTVAFLTKDVEKRLGLNWCKKITPDKLVEIISEDYSFKNYSFFDTEKIAELIFTSGSTGVPKGVMLSHKNLIANTKSIVEYLELSQNDRMLVVMPFFYCYGLSLLHTHIRVGGSIVLNNSFIFIGAVINDLINQKCTGFAGVPSHFQILLRKSDTFIKTPLPDLRYVTQAGGKLSTVFIDEFRDAFPKVKFYVMYGQTEATARLSYLPPELYESKKGSLGKGIPGVELKVVDEQGIPVKPGIVGEIIAKGDNVMSGYINDSEETAKTIRNGWLHTGDLAIVDEEDFIYHSARKKEIIKVGGKRISPKEIEEVILRMHEVVDCSIEAIQDELLGEAMKAIVVVKNTNDTSLTADIVKEHCSKNLTLYKVPQIIEFREKMELSSSGKKVKAKL